MKSMRYTITVLVDGERFVNTFDGSGECEWYSLSCEQTGRKTIVTVTPRRPLIMAGAKAEMEWRCGRKDRILLNGFQSWTDTRELTVRDHMRGIRHTPGIIVRHYGLHAYGDYGFIDYTGKRGELHGFSYGYIRRGDSYDLVGSLGEEEGYTVLRYSAKTQTLRVCRDCGGLEITEPYKALAFTCVQGGCDEVFDGWFADAGIAKPRVEPVCGYTSWYNHYTNVTEKIIDENLTAMDTLPVKTEVFQIDDGYEAFVGDWLECDPVKFPNGVKWAADAIHASGRKAGLWLAPFVVETKSRIYREHPDWLKKDRDGKPVCCGCNWSGFYALDLENSEVLDYLRRVFDTVLGEWGFDLVKLDFLYAAALVPDKTMTRGGQMCRAMDLIRELCGDKLILGCGVPLMPAFGKVDYCRIGCDVSLDWNDKFIMRIAHRERVSTRNSILDTIYRRGLDGRAFLNDPDVFYLRDENLKLTMKRRLQLATVNNLFASLRFISDNCSLYDENKRKLYKELTSLRSDAKIISINDNRRSVSFVYETGGKKEKMRIKL